MNRRSFIRGLVALPVIGTAVAKTAWAQEVTIQTERANYLHKALDAVEHSTFRYYSGYDVLDIKPEDLLKAGDPVYLNEGKWKKCLD